MTVLRRVRRAATGCLFLAGAVVAPQLGVDGLEVPLPRSILPLPVAVECGSATVRITLAGATFQLDALRLRDPRGRGTLTIPRAEIDPAGRISIPHAELDVAAAPTSPPERSDPIASARAIRTALAEVAATIPVERVGALTIEDATIRVAGRRWSEHARLDLAGDGSGLRGLVSLGSVFPQADLFVEVAPGRLALSAELDSALVGDFLVSGRASLVDDVVNFDLGVDGTRIDGAGRLAPGRFEVDACSGRTNLSWIRRHWLPQLAPGARRWVDRHLVRGTASTGHLAGIGDSFTLDFGFEGVDADLPGVPLPISHARGRGRITADRLELWVDRARAGSLAARRGRVVVTGLGAQAGRLTLRADLLGPAAGALQLLDAPPFRPDRSRAMRSCTWRSPRRIAGRSAPARSR